MLECSSSTTAARINRPDGKPALLGDDAAGVDHRGHAAFHVLRAAAVEPAVALDRRERIRHARDADRVGVAAEHQRAALARAPRARRRRWAVRARPLRLDVEAEAAHLGGDGVGDLALARRTGHERRVDGVDRDEIAEQADGWIHEVALQRSLSVLVVLVGIYVGRHASRLGSSGD